MGDTDFLRVLDGPSSAAEPAVDIVFVHGLNPRNTSDFAHATWTHANKNFWPQAQLAQLQPTARVLLFSYNSHVASDVSTNGIQQHAANLLLRLRGKRAAASESTRPIIFVAHSMGGLVVKQALVAAKNNDRYKTIREATCGLVFFAVPHRGGNGAPLGTIAKNLVNFLAGESRNDLVESLKRNSLFQENQAALFKEQLEDYHVVSIVEDRPMTLVRVLGITRRMIIVDGKSATLGLAGTRENVLTLNSDHSEVCRFAGDDDKFEPVKQALEELVMLAAERQASVASPPAGVRASPTSNAAAYFSGQSSGTQLGQNYGVMNINISHREDPPNRDALGTICSLPFPPNEHFVGRRKQLDQLQDKLITEGHSRAVLCGLGGVGKTQVALAFAYTIKASHPNCSIFWVPLVSAAVAEQAFGKIARLLKLSAADARTGITAMVCEYLSQDSAGEWLLILDNADTRAVLYEPDGVSLVDYLPSSANGSVLFTTRNLAIASSLAGNVIEVDEMDVSAARELLEKSLITKPQEPDQVLELLTELTCLPLAITQAAAYINVTKTTIEDYIALLKNTESRTEVLSRNIEDRTRYRKSANAIAGTWLVSFDQIQIENPLAADLLTFMSCIESKAIPRAILPDEASEENMTFALGILSAYAFISEQSDRSSYDIHRLVHLASGIWVKEKGISGERTKSVFERITKVFPYPEYENRDLRGLLSPHAQKILKSHRKQEFRTKYTLGMTFALSLEWDGRHKEALQLYLELDQWTSSLADDNPERLELQHNLACSFDQNGKKDRAIRLLQSIMDIEKRTLAEDHPSLIVSRHELAGMYNYNGQVARAIPLLLQNLEIEKSHAENDPDRLISQHALALAYRANGQIEKAIALFEHVVKTRTPLAEDHPDRLGSQHELALAYRQNGQIEKAIALVEHVVKIQTPLAEDHPDRLGSQHALAVAYQENGQVEQAVALLEHVVKVEKTLPEHHPSRVLSEKALQRAYSARGGTPSKRPRVGGDRASRKR